MITKIYLVIEALTMILCLQLLYGRRFSLSRKAVAFIVAQVVFLESIRFWQLDRIYSLLLYGLIFFYCAWEYGWKPAALLVNELLCVMVLTALQVAGAIPFALLGEAAFGEDVRVLCIQCFVLFIVLTLLPRLKLDRLSMLLQKREFLLGLTILTGAVGAFGLLAAMKQRKMLLAGQYLFTGLSILLLCVLAYKWQSSRLQAMEKEMELKVYETYDKAYGELIREVKRKQHDYRNHLNAILSFHYTSTSLEELIEGQRNYYDSISGETRMTKVLQTGDSLIAGFLYVKEQEAMQKGVTVQVKGSLWGWEKRLPGYKLVEMLGNLLDNAIEAAQGFEEESDRVVRIAFGEKESEAFFSVSNRIGSLDYDLVEKMFQEGYSSKGKERGIGLYNVKRNCGELDCDLIVEKEEFAGKEWLTFRLRKRDHQKSLNCKR